ncbi:MAG: hypothetical protein ACI9MR_001418 [Myxococcota bacterium]|jgi:hypothetical protein
MRVIKRLLNGHADEMTRRQDVPMNTKSLLTLIAIAGVVSGCSQAEEGALAEGLRITVAPLTLDNVEEVSYGIKVRSATETVWERTGLTSTQYGDGQSAVTYIGPCDASNNPHTIELTIEEIRADGQALVDPGDFINPAPAGQPLRQVDVTCVENGDVLVAFDITVIRNAQQGFFDVAVNFDDIFCSAKVDCRDAFLHDPTTDDRGASAIVGFACTAGENSPTYLHTSDLTLSCTGAAGTVTYPLANGGGLGQHGPVTAAGVGVPGVFDWATYQGNESLTSNGEPLQKCFWNRAVGLDLTSFQAGGVTSCTLSGIATASETPEISDVLGGTSSSYPIIRFSVDVLSEGTTLCENQPLNGDGSGVTTEYVTSDTDPTTLQPFTGTLSCGDKVVVCDPNNQVQQVGDSITVTSGGASITMPLPDGMDLDDSCCVDGCCGQLPDVNLVISADTEDYDLFVAAGSPAVAANFIVTVNNGVTVSASGGMVPAFTTGALPNGSTVTLINNGNIYGAGGQGGTAGTTNSGVGGTAHSVGFAGGDAITTTVALTIDNSTGNIFGGGGGGGGGALCTITNVLACGGSGGGGQGLAGGPAGDKGFVCASGAPYPGGDAGTAGTDTGTGLGGAGAGSGLYSSDGSHFFEPFVCTSGAGGDGGSWGEPGLPAGPSNFEGQADIPGIAGGAAGPAVRLNGNTVTWLGGNVPAQVKGPVQ